MISDLAGQLSRKFKKLSTNLKVDISENDSLAFLNGRSRLCRRDSSNLKARLNPKITVWQGSSREKSKKFKKSKNQNFVFSEGHKFFDFSEGHRLTFPRDINYLENHKNVIYRTRKDLSSHIWMQNFKRLKIL